MVKPAPREGQKKTSRELIREMMEESGGAMSSSVIAGILGIADTRVRLIMRQIRADEVKGAGGRPAIEFPTDIPYHKLTMIEIKLLLAARGISVSERTIDRKIPNYKRINNVRRKK